jgi:hypothetical protein
MRLPLSPIPQTNTNCSSDLTNYTTDIIPNGGAGGFVVTATAAVTPNGSGGFTLSNIAANTSINFTITDANGCQQTGSTAAPKLQLPNGKSANRWGKCHYV